MSRLFETLLPLWATLVALAIGALILLLMGADPVEGYTAMFTGAFGNKNGLADVLVKATPLLLVALGIAIAFRGGTINIGAEGQLIMGALVTAAVGVGLGESVGKWVGIGLCIAAGTLTGALYGAIPGYLKARLNVNEILSTIMLNQIAIQISYFMLRGAMLDPKQIEQGTNVPQSARLGRVYDLPRFTDIAKSLGYTESAKNLEIEGFRGELYGLLVEPTRAHTGLILAIVMAILVYVLLWRTTVGYRIRMVGQNAAAARYAGVNVAKYTTLSLALSGAFAGLAGAIEIVGLHHRMFEPEAVSAGYGFSGIVVALFGKLHPLGAIPAALLFGGLLVGGDKMQRAIQVPNVLVTVILGLVVLFVVSSEIIVKRRSARRVGVEKQTPLENPPLNPPRREGEKKEGKEAQP